jgi:hypothetical protein
MNRGELYLDLDGVLVGFFEGADPILVNAGFPPFMDEYWKQYGQDRADDIRWAIIKKVPDFWKNLPYLDEGRQLWNYCYYIKPHILTAGQRRMPECEEGKLYWLDKHIGLKNLNKVHIVKRSEKKDYALNNGIGNVLVDDYEFNCIEWEEAGGTAILHTSTQNTIRELKKLGF